MYSKKNQSSDCFGMNRGWGAIVGRYIGEIKNEQRIGPLGKFRVVHLLFTFTVIISPLYANVKNDQIVHFKYMQLFSGQVCLNKAVF